MDTHLLFELLVDSIQRIFYCDTFHVSCCYTQAQWELQVNLLDWRGCEGLLEDVFVIESCRRGVQFPVEIARQVRDSVL